MKRQILVFVLTLLSLVSKATLIDGINYRFNSENNTAGVIYYSEYSGDVIIPDVVQSSGVSYRVTYISEEAFDNCSQLTSITIGNNVEFIGNYAFRGCSSLTSAVIGNSVSYIGWNAFNGCSNLSSISIGYKFDTVGNDAFYGCNNISSVTFHCKEIKDWFSGFESIQSIEIGDEVTAIGDNAFTGCGKISQINIPYSVISIGKKAFWGCHIPTVTIANGLQSIGEDAFFSEIDSVHISDLAAWCNISFANGLSNPICRSRCFVLNDKEIKELIIPSNIKTIADYAFFGCPSLSSITIPDNVTSIGDNSFARCYDLKSVIFHCKEIKDWFRDQVNINNIEIGKEVISVSENAFKGCSGISSVKFHCNTIGSWFSELPNISNIEIGDEVTSIGDYAFSGCSGLTAIAIPNSVTTIGKSSFKGCTGLDIIAIGSNVSSIGDYAFFECTNLTNVTLNRRLKDIGVQSFALCEKLKEIIIPDSVYSIGDLCFSDCYDLKKIVLGAQVGKIGKNAFTELASNSIVVSYILFKSGSSNYYQIPNDLFQGTRATLYIPDMPKSWKSSYQKAPWTNFPKIEEKVILVMMGDYNREYGDSNPSFEPIFYYGDCGDVAGSPTIICEATEASPCKGYLIKMEKGTMNYDYIRFWTGILSVKKAPLTVSVGNYSRMLGEDNPGFELTYEGFKNGETPSVLTTQPTVSCSATKNSPVGEYEITLSGGKAINYDFNYISGKLTITENPSSGIDELADNTTKKVNVYSLDGTLIARDLTSFEDLPKGVYIINKKKHIKK